MKNQSKVRYRTFQLRFLKPSKEQALKRFGGDEQALASAHEQAVRASQSLIAKLLTLHDEPVPMIRMDWMLKRLAPGKAQVVFGEYCAGLKGSIGEGSNHSNFSDPGSVRILSKLKNFR